MPANELKPCPFCGTGKPEPYADSYEISFIQCSCGARGAKADDLNIATELWNSRAGSSEVAQ
ncbi:Lar family restriction alleviation protein [Serratia bockelmannii]|uniref:Lar family restriction alleviation protein n=1 Tax=Serratia bockelmannii TaxID=2703793 RepID=UPI0038698357